MKKIFVILSLFSFLFSNDELLLELAKKNHLEAIPENKIELLKLTNQSFIVTNEKIELGKTLFFDPRLSKSNLISCNTCHNLALGGADGVSSAIGHNWSENPMKLNSPTVYNAVFAFYQNYSGNIDNLQTQVSGPIHASFEMASSKDEIEKKLRKINGYKTLFEKAYGKSAKIDFEELTEAIAAFESTLITPSRFDRFLLGESDALNSNEKKGLEIFINKRCAQCHKGVALGGSKVVFRHDRYTYSNIGGFKGNENQLVKVPTLRNISQTAPYFHNGAILDLKDAIIEMGKIQLNLKLSKEDVDYLYDFLKSLDGEKPKIIYPMLPY